MAARLPDGVVRAIVARTNFSARLFMAKLHKGTPGVLRWRSLSTGEERVIGSNSDLKDAPSLSPDGRAIVYAVLRNNSATLCYSSQPGSSIRALCTGCSRASDWRRIPIVFSSFRVPRPHACECCIFRMVLPAIESRSLGWAYAWYACHRTTNRSPFAPAPNSLSDRGAPEARRLRARRNDRTSG